MCASVDVDEALVERVMAITGLPTRRAAVEAGLHTLLRLADQTSILALAGAVQWDGDLDAMREGRTGGT